MLLLKLVHLAAAEFSIKFEYKTLSLPSEVTLAGEKNQRFTSPIGSKIGYTATMKLLPQEHAR